MINNPVNCIFCGSAETHIRFSTSDIYFEKYSIFHCSQCNAYFLNPIPDALSIQKYYDDSYYGQRESKFSGTIEKYIDLFRKRKAKSVLKYLPENGNILDIGCGNGRFLNYISSYGNYGIYGTELAGNSANRAKKYDIKLKIGKLEQNDFAPGFFNVITMFHVFEHLDEPKKTLEIISEILAKNGVLILSMPDIGSWQARAFKGKWLHLDPPRHLLFFERKKLIELMKAYGFECIKHESISFEQNPFGWVQSCLNAMLNRRDVLFERLKGNKKFAPEYSAIAVFFQKVFMAFTLPYFFIQEIIESLFKKSATFKMTFQKQK